MYQNVENTCFVSDLPLSTQENELRSVFIKFGQILSVTVIGNTRSGYPNAYVKFKEKEDMEDAIETMNGEAIDGQHIKVKEIESPESKQDRLQNRCYECKEPGAHQTKAEYDPYKTCTKIKQISKHRYRHARKVKESGDRGLVRSEERGGREIMSRGGDRYHGSHSSRDRYHGHVSSGSRGDRFGGGGEHSGSHRSGDHRYYSHGSGYGRGNCYVCGNPGHFARDCPSTSRH